MRFVSSVQAVEAERFELAGEEFFGVAVAGRAHAIAAEVFRLFFAPEAREAATGKESLQAAATDPKTAAVVGVIRSTAGKKAAPHKKEPQRKIAVSETGLTSGQAVQKAVGEQPRTRTETTDRACVLMGWSAKDPKARATISAVISYQLDRGQLVRKDDPNTQLPFLYLAGGEQ